MRMAPSGPTVGLVSIMVLLSAVSLVVGLGWPGWAVGLASAGSLSALLAWGLRRSDRSTLGPAGRVTLSRAVLACGVAAVAADTATGPATWGDRPAGALRILVALTSLALALDLLDGLVARRTGTVSSFGAQFDMEVDAFLILALSLHVAAADGWWVAGIGLARYVLLVAQRLTPWLRRRLPAARWRKVVAAYQGIALTAGAGEALAPRVTLAVLVLAAVALATSFGTEVTTLWRIRQTPTIEPVRSAIGMVIE